jgi:hypothetical protein
MNDSHAASLSRAISCGSRSGRKAIASHTKHGKLTSSTAIPPSTSWVLASGAILPSIRRMCSAISAANDA